MPSPRLTRRVAVVFTAVVCALFAIVFAIRSASARAVPRAPRTPSGDRRPLVFRSPPQKDEPAPLHVASDVLVLRGPKAAAPTHVVTYLHGICGRTENGCPHVSRGAGPLGWSVCPRGPSICGGNQSWSGNARLDHATVVRAERLAEEAGAPHAAPRVLVGFSQGAFVALGEVARAPGRYRGLVLIGADVAPSGKDLARAGVERIALLAGDRDAASLPMARAARALAREGFDVRFASLGDVGHTYVGDTSAALRDAVAWAGGSGAARP